MFPYEDSKTVSVRPSVSPYPEKRNHLSFVNISPTSVAKWCINGKVFTSTTAGKLKNLIFFFFSKKFEIEIWLVPKSWILLSFVNISPTLVIDTSMDRSLRALQHGNPKIWFFFQKSLKLNFVLCQRAEIIQVRLNMHLYDDIGDASSYIDHIRPPYMTGDVYWFPRRQLIFSFGRRVIYNSTCLWEYILKLIPSVCTTIFKRLCFYPKSFDVIHQWVHMNELCKFQFRIIKIFKWITLCEYWSKFNVFYINGFVSTSSTN